MLGSPRFSCAPSPCLAHYRRHVKYYERSVDHHVAERPLQALPPASRHGKMPGWRGRSRSSILRGHRWTEADRSFRCIDSLSIARHTESQQTDDFDPRRATAGVSTHFPQCLRRHRSELVFGQFRSCPIQPSSTRHVHYGFPRASLHRHAPLPSLLPGLDKAVALQHLSLVLIFYKTSSQAA